MGVGGDKVFNAGVELSLKINKSRDAGKTKQFFNRKSGETTQIPRQNSRPKVKDVGGRRRGVGKVAAGKSRGGRGEVAGGSG